MILERAFGLASVLVAILCLPSLAWAELRFGPYLQSTAPDSVSVCAFVEEGDEVRVRLLVPDGAAREIDAVGHAPALARLTGLLPELEYRYELFVGGQRVTGDPPPGFVARSDVMQTFIILGDTRSGEESFSLAHDQVVRAIRKNAVPDAIFHTGDFIEDGDSLELWESFFQIERDLLARAPLFPAIGQSDQPALVMRGLFPVLAESPWYGVDRGAAHLAVLNLWQSRSQGPEETAEDGAQATWLRRELAAARARGAHYLFVAFHEPAIDLGGRSSKAVREVYMPIFEAFDVTAVFSGAHYFSHAVRNGVHYFTNGGGGALLDTGTPEEGVFRFFRATYHFLVLEVDRFGARISAVDAHGSSFYSATFSDASAATSDPAAPTFVESFPAGTGSVAMTVFFLPGCKACDSFKAGLWDVALRTGSSLEVTFRSAEDPDNRAALSALTDSRGPVPIVVVGGRVLTGTEQIERELDAAIREATALPGPKRSTDARWIVALVSLVAGLVLLGALRRGRGRVSTRHHLLMLAPALLIAPAIPVGAGANSSDSPSDSEAKPIDTIVVVASPPESDLPGSGIRLDEDAIRKHSYADINRVLARVPGVYLRQEEGYGLFPNISLRGVDSLRTTKVTLMEDRVPAVPAPYSAPASYYAPNIARMRGIEVLKGSSQVRYGPHTTGGVINYLSTAIPGRQAIYLNTLYGSQNEVRAHAAAGDTLRTSVGEVGYLLEGYLGRTDGFKKIDRKPGISSTMADETGFLRVEPMLKLAWKPDTEVYQRLEAKLGYTHLDADETYLGLSDADFEADPFRRYAASRFANMRYEHWRTYLRHIIEPTENVSLVTTAYYGKFDRNWFKSLEVGDATGFMGLSEALAAGGNHLEVLRGDAAGTLRYRNNNRHYYLAGIDHMTGYEIELAPGRHTWTAGARYHRDRSRRFQTDEWFEQLGGGSIGAHTVGEAGGSGNLLQESQALALFLEDKIEFEGLGLALTLGGRFEQIWQDFDDRNDPDVPEASEDYAVAAGGVGATYAFDENLRVFCGLYRGYSVPDPQGAVARDLVPETSINFEAGLRYALPEQAFRGEATFFFSHFDDLIVASVVDAEGGLTTDNVGQIDSLGVELSFDYDPGVSFEWPVRNPWFASFTYTRAVLASDTQSVEPASIFSNGRKGNRVPYVPELQFSIGSGVEYGVLGISLIASYVDEMYTSASNTSDQVRWGVDPSGIPLLVPDARFGKTDPYFVVDLAADCQIHEHVRLKLSVHNLLDREQMVSRHPEGPRPGPPLTVLGGLEAAF